MTSTLTPFRIQKHLAGLRYPAHRNEIVRRALETGADDRVLGMLRAIPERWYPRPVDVSGEIARRRRA